MSMRSCILFFVIFLFPFLNLRSTDKSLKSGSSDFRDETIYFVMTDRFVDGDKNNNNIYGDEYNFGNLKSTTCWPVAAR